MGLTCWEIWFNNEFSYTAYFTKHHHKEFPPSMVDVQIRQRSECIIALRGGRGPGSKITRDTWHYLWLSRIVYEAYASGIFTNHVKSKRTFTILDNKILTFTLLGRPLCHDSQEIKLSNNESRTIKYADHASRATTSPSLKCNTWVQCKQFLKINTLTNVFSIVTFILKHNTTFKLSIQLQAGIFSTVIAKSQTNNL